jgi:diguanylate cyclase (GGDEF)-like protein
MATSRVVPGRRLWLIYLVGGLAASAGSLLLADLPQSIVYDLVGLSAVVSILCGVRLHRLRRRGMWYGLAGGLVVFVAGDVVYSVYVYALDLEPFPSPADALYLASYPILAAALLVMIRSRTGGRDRAGLIDALVIATGLGLLSWTFLMRPIASDPSLTLGSRLISLAYPLADVLLLAVLARLVTSPGARSMSYRLLAAAVLLQLGADIVYAGLTVSGTYAGGLIDLAWMVSYLCWGAAALHPSVRSLSEVAPARGVRVTRARLLVLAPAALIAPGLLLLQGSRGLTIDWVALGVGSVVLFLLVVARMSDLVAQVQDQAAQLAALAHNDALTGIPNRRAWDLDLVREMIRARRTGAPLHVALLDIDYFKRFNDTNGHQAGDLLLKSAAAAWRAQLREGDMLARYGGEEFAVMLVGCSQAEAVAILDRMRAATPLGETVSIGVVQWDGEQTPEQLIGAADDALYRAKERGRDRVVASLPPGSQPGGDPSSSVIGAVRPGLGG